MGILRPYVVLEQAFIHPGPKSAITHAPHLGLRLPLP